MSVNAVDVFDTFRVYCVLHSLALNIVQRTYQATMYFLIQLLSDNAAHASNSEYM